MNDQVRNLSGETRVKRRHVFYLSGYDPRGPSHYHGLYRDEAPKQTPLNGLAIEVGPRRKTGETEYSWVLRTAVTKTTYSFLRYDDIMRARWAKTNWGVLLEILRYFGLFLRRGVFARVMRISWPMFLTIAYAPALVLFAIILAVMALVAANWFAGLLAGFAAFMAVFALAIMLRQPLEERINAFWLARILSFVSDQGAGATPEIERRMDDWAQRIAALMKTGAVDEILLAGHSIGSQLVISIAARVVKAFGGALPKTPQLSILTLGQTIPLQSLQPKAAPFREEIETVITAPHLEWIDVSAPIDSACFPLSDPVAASGLKQPDPTNPRPKLLNARFAKLFRPESYAVLRRQFQRAHFQYLMACEIAGDYDYFLITAGDMTLGDRFRRLKSVEGFNRFRLGKT